LSRSLDVSSYMVPTLFVSTICWEMSYGLAPVGFIVDFFHGDMFEFADRINLEHVTWKQLNNQTIIIIN
jgi:hypothetical protein